MRKRNERISSRNIPRRSSYRPRILPVMSSIFAQTPPCSNGRTLHTRAGTHAESLAGATVDQDEATTVTITLTEYQRVQAIGRSATPGGNGGASSSSSLAAAFLQDFPFLKRP